MKIDIPKVIVPVDLGEYAPGLKSKFLQVWVNMPKERLQAYDDLVTEVQEHSLAEASKNVDHGLERESSVLSTVLTQVQAMLRRKRDKKADGIDRKLLQWYAEMWSQGPEESRWTATELEEVEQQDPAFLSWCIARSWAERNEHVQRKKKV